MIKLEKADKPDILTEEEINWRDELLSVLARNERPTDAIKSRYRHASIKAALIDETKGKCAYCESKVTHVTYGDIEHIIPKSKVPARAFEWANLTIACDVCNTNKGDHYSDDPANSHDELIDPYNDDPSEHFLFLGEVVTPRPDSLRGFKTNEVLKLSRGALIEKRRERIDFLNGLVRAYSLAPDEFKSVLLNDIFSNHVTEDKEYFAASKSYLEVLKSKGILPDE